MDGRGALRAGAALALAATLLGVAIASAPLFVSSAGTAMLADELASHGDGLTVLEVRGSGAIGAEDLEAADRALTTAFAEEDLGQAERSLVIQAEVAETGERVNLIGRDGDAWEQLPPVVEPAEGDARIMVPDATRLQLEAGDELAVAQPGDQEPLVVGVGATIERFDREDMPPAWRPLTGLVTVIDDDPQIPPPPPALLMEYDHASSLLDALGHQATEDGLNVQVTWAIEVDPGLTLEQAQALAPRVEALRGDVVDPASELGGYLAAPGWAPPVVGGRQVDAAVERVSRAVGELEVPVRLLGMTGQVLALGGVAAAVTLGGQRQLSRSRLWAVRGVPAAQLGLRWAATGAVPVAIGVVLGRGAAEVLVRRLGPSETIDGTTLSALWWELAGAALLSVLVIGVVATFAVRWQLRSAGTTRRIPPVAEAAAVLLAAVALWQADVRDGVVTAATDGTLQVDPLAVALPILLVVAAAGVGMRLLAPVLRALGRRPARHPVWFLASRRLRTFGGATMGLAFLTASAVGLLVLASTLHSSAQATMQEKTGLTFGADAVAPLSRSSVTDNPDPAAMPVPATQVRRAPEVSFEGRTVELLAIDPETFADVAYSPRHLAQLDLHALMALLPAEGQDAPRPAIAVGEVGGEVGTVAVSDVELPVEVVAEVPVFPGAGREQPTLVVADGGPLAPEDPAVTARLAVDLFPDLWFSQEQLDLATFRARLDPVDLPDVGSGLGARGPVSLTYTAEVRDDPGVAPATWTFTYLRGQASVVALLGFVALLGHHTVRQRQQVLGTELAGRMGLRRRSRLLTEFTELAGLAAATLGLGAVAGAIAARTVVDRYDPMPDVGLPVVFQLPLDVLAAPLVAATLAIGVAVFVTMWAVDRVPIAAVLRGDP